MVTFRAEESSKKFRNFLGLEIFCIFIWKQMFCVFIRLFVYSTVYVCVCIPSSGFVCSHEFISFTEWNIHPWWYYIAIKTHLQLCGLQRWWAKEAFICVCVCVNTHVHTHGQIDWWTLKMHAYTISRNGLHRESNKRKWV